MNDFIVGEISKTWLNGASASPLLLSEQFEQMIAVNQGRCYRLHSFNVHRLMVAPDQMNETLIAVFERTICSFAS